MAHFDVHGGVAEHVRRHVVAWSDLGVRLVVVSTSTLTPAARGFLEDHATLVERPNHGYDFLSYKVGLAEAGDLAAYDDVVLTNDTFVGPLRPYEEIFAAMADRPVDFWGLTRSDRVAPHLQSFFVVFRPWVVASQAFTRFWAGMIPVSDRKQVIHRYEVGLSRTLVDAGFAFGSYFAATPGDERVARRRMLWWALHRPPGPSPKALRDGTVARRAREPWNPSIALADRALAGGRLPFVKLDTLRYDPYDLGSDRLLAACEQAFPDAFSGVRAFLEQTAEKYVPRAEERTLPTPTWARGAHQLVAYA